jgi:hypothetical protein
MASPSSLSSLDYATLLSTTLMNYRGQFYDNIHNAIPIFWKMRNKKRTEEGGERIKIPLAYAKNSTFKSISGYEPVDTTPQEPLTTAFSEWKEMAGSIGISREEENKNRGKYQIINMLQAKVTTAELSAAEELAEQAVGTISTSDPAKDLSPLHHLIQKTPSGAATVENIAQGTYAWWRNQIKDSAATTWAGFIAEMATLYNQCSKGAGAGKRSEPDSIFCDMNYYEVYEAACRDKTRIIKYDETVANLGFGGAKYRNAILMWDEYMPDINLGTSVTSETVDTYSYTNYSALFVNTMFLEYVVMAGSDLDMGPFIKPENQVVRTAIIYNMANMVCSNRRKQGAHYTISTSITS